MNTKNFHLAIFCIFASFMHMFLIGTMVSEPNSLAQSILAHLDSIYMILGIVILSLEIENSQKSTCTLYRTETITKSFVKTLW